MQIACTLCDESFPAIFPMKKVIEFTAPRKSSYAAETMQLSNCSLSSLCGHFVHFN